MDIKLFSLVVPAYREEKTIAKNLQIIEGVLKKLPCDYEIIVVVDGDMDKTLRIVRNISKKNRKIKVFGEKENNGKGYAVKYGILKAKGDIVGFIDADLNLDPLGITTLFDFMRLHDADIVLGSKTHPDSVIDYPIYRRILSFVYMWINQFLFGLRILDTQTGLKIFKRKVAMDVFPRLLVKKFAFDIEMLAVANVLGYHEIYEAPIKLKFKTTSITSKNFWRASLRTLWDTLAVFYRIRILKYYRKSNRKNWLT